jgi:hypothetical protein
MSPAARRAGSCPTMPSEASRASREESNPRPRMWECAPMRSIRVRSRLSDSRFSSAMATTARRCRFGVPVWRLRWRRPAGRRVRFKPRAGNELELGFCHRGAVGWNWKDVDEDSCGPRQEKKRCQPNSVRPIHVMAHSVYMLYPACSCHRSIGTLPL